MAHLTLAGVSDDGSRLLLVDDEGVEHDVEIDQRLRTALGGESRRLENKMDSALRPRDIQTRIRAGETPETVAQAAQTSVDKIMAFAAPVLAEREHVAQRAQRSSVRRPEGTGGARALGDAVGAHLRSLNVDPDSVEWDAWRREDGRWPLTASYSLEGRSGTAEFLFDAPGNYVTIENDDARWLVGEAVAEAAAEPVADDLRQARQRRLSAVGELDDQLPLGDDAIDLVTEQPVEAFLETEEPTDPEVAAEAAELREEAEEAAAEDDLHEKQEHQEPQRREVKKTRGRASVPSWDEIMFGGGKSE
ncbi:septation protein SepH [Nocardioides sp. SR21]|uniref:septation protein SepH n=1 Tax=Nocardioides sp. SR21 TaxID=2919501 RepID=UPI001FA94B73|nr:septation protein SepH [Nocardioides sp. SR21]